MTGNFESGSITVRPYTESDLNQLERLDMFIVLQIKYHGGVKGENVFCAIENNNVTGAGILTLFREGRAEFSVYADDPAVKEALTECLIGRFLELHKENNAKIVLRTCRSSDKLTEIQFFLSKGFRTDNMILLLKYDLSGPIAHYSIPGEVEIKPYEFTDESMPKYLKAAEDAGLLPLKDSADSWFRTGAPGFACFAALHNGEVIGSATILDVPEECGVTEFIFVLPSFRRNNIARELIATALSELQNRGKKEARLTVFGANWPAVNLYLSMGYRLTDSLVELKLQT